MKDDIGDKSVFMFNALPEEEKKALSAEARGTDRAEVQIADIDQAQ
jgi:hypothetical protein